MNAEDIDNMRAKMNLSPEDMGQTSLVYACPYCGRTVIVTYPAFATPPTDCYCQYPNAVVLMLPVPKPVLPVPGDDISSQKPQLAD